MSIVVVGINHKTAPVTVREKAYFAVDRLSLYLHDLLACEFAREAVLMSTCNRSEIYCDTSDIEKIRVWFGAQTTLSMSELEPYLYCYEGIEAVDHIMQVACGLDSMIVGEPQILGQLKEAYSESCTAGAVSVQFHRLFQQVFSTAKEIRTSTSIGACPVSVASAAVKFVNERMTLSKAKVALIGAGDTTELILRYLQAHLDKPIALVNRSIEHAETITERFGGKAFGLHQITEALEEADIVFSATGSPVPVLTKAIVETIMMKRSAKPLLLLDIAVPRDIDPAVLELMNVSLYCIDDLKSIIETNKRGREHAAEKARELIRERSAEFMNSLKSIEKISHTIRAYRGQIEDICQVELLKAKQQLELGIDPAVALDNFARAFTKKLMHAPSVQLRQAGEEGHFELLKFAKQLFAIPDSEIEHL